MNALTYGTNTDASKSAQMVVGPAPNTFLIIILIFLGFCMLSTTWDTQCSRNSDKKTTTTKQTNKCTSNINKKSVPGFLLTDLPGRSLYSRSGMSITSWFIVIQRELNKSATVGKDFTVMQPNLFLFFFLNLVLSGWLLDLLQVPLFFVDGDVTWLMYFLRTAENVKMIAKRGLSP